MKTLIDRDIREFGVQVKRLTVKDLELVEILSHAIPSIARPHCCYLGTVIFYVYPYIEHWSKYRNYVEFGGAQSLMTWDVDFMFEGDIYRCAGGRVIRRRKSWWMRHHARRIIETNQTP